MEITTAAGIADGEPIEPRKDDSDIKNVEKGSGYGPPKEGSGKMVPANEGIPSEKALEQSKDNSEDK